MKKYNTRLLVTSGLLLALTTVAMSTGTYAWFTVNKTAAFSATASVKADNNVEIQLAECGGHMAGDYVTTSINLDYAYGQTDSTAYKANLAKTTPDSKTHTLQDISGDGATFYKPVFAADNATFNSLSTVSTYENYYMTARFLFRSDKAYHIMIGDVTNMITDTNTATGDKATALNTAARLAFFDSGKDGSTSVSRTSLRQIVYDGSDAEYYISANTATTSTTNDSGSAATGYSSFASMVVTDANYKITASDTAETLKIPLADASYSKPTSIAAGHTAGRRTLCVLEKNGTYTSADGSEIDAYTGSVTIVFWIEGADAQCINANRDGKLSVAVDFAALIA